MSSAAESMVHLDPRPVPAIAGLRPMQLRWAIWAEQEYLNHQPCFGTERRIFCEERDCAWRSQCMSLRAQWRR